MAPEWSRYGKRSPIDIHSGILVECSSTCSWDAVQGFQQSTLLARLASFDKDSDHFHRVIIPRLEPYLKRDDLSPEAVMKSSAAAGGICYWMHNMVAYGTAAAKLTPLRARVADLTRQIRAAEARLGAVCAPDPELVRKLLDAGAEVDP